MGGVRLSVAGLRILVLGVLCTWGVSPVPLQACGPFFPSTILDEDTPAVLAAPPAHLRSELAALSLGREAPVPPCVVHGEQGSLPLELAELRDLLLARGVESAERTRLVEAYARVRRSMRVLGDPAQEVQEPLQERVPVQPPPGAADGAGTEWVDAAASPAPRRPDLTLPPELPPEFGLYLRGAQVWREGDLELAQQHWLALLALPEGERRHRSVWASYMLGRCALAGITERKGAELTRAAEEATRWFVQARALAAQGFPDVAGLASESLGWEGRAALVSEDFPRAFARYFEQHRSGDTTAFQSLRVSAFRALKAGPERLGVLARDPLCRRLVTAYLVSRSLESVYDEYNGDGLWAEQSKAWSTALKVLPLSPLPEADRLAWIAYDAGDLEVAHNWLVQSSNESPVTWWLRAKLSLRVQGSQEQAEAFYRAALARPGLDAFQLKRLQSELGRLCLARDKFEDALSLWMQAGDWEAAAYIAERVISASALQQWVDGEADKLKLPPESLASLRHLLARRLAREDRAGALNYFPPPLAEQYRSYLAHLKVAHNSGKSPQQRGRAFMAAARILRHQGMELLGMEFAPDGFAHGGSYQLPDRAQDKRGDYNDPLTMSSEERERLARYPLPQNGRRFHYRYRAAELAWLGISLMPNDNDETAALLCEAGGWLKARDPQAADLFYKALVVRCRHTRLGEQADSLRWFPPSLGDEGSAPERDWGVRSSWLLGCWALAIAVPVLGTLLFRRLRRRA